MLKKILLSIFLISFLTFASVKAAVVFENSTKISKNVLIGVYPLKTISTASVDEGDSVYFINPSDLWVYEINVIPKNSYFKGQVEMLRMPVKGVNAAMVVKITEIIYPDGTSKKIAGTLTEKGKNQIGGDLTPPASYNRMVHPREGMYWKRAGVLQYVPSGEYEMGLHVTLPTNELVYIRLDEDFDSASDTVMIR